MIHLDQESRIFEWPTRQEWSTTWFPKPVLYVQVANCAPSIFYKVIFGGAVYV